MAKADPVGGTVPAPPIRCGVLRDAALAPLLEDGLRPADSPSFLRSTRLLARFPGRMETMFAVYGVEDAPQEIRILQKAQRKSSRFPAPARGLLLRPATLRQLAAGRRFGS